MLKALQIHDKKQMVPLYNYKQDTNRWRFCNLKFGRSIESGEKGCCSFVLYAERKNKETQINPANFLNGCIGLPNNEKENFMV